MKLASEDSPLVRVWPPSPAANSPILRIGHDSRGAPSPEAVPILTIPPPLAPSQAWVRQSVGKLDLGAVTIDDIANRDPRVRTAPVLTSPRSIRACLEHGVEPAMLVPKRVSDFADPGLDPELQRHKWEHHEQIRLERVDVLNAARRACPPRRPRRRLASRASPAPPSSAERPPPPPRSPPLVDPPSRAPCSPEKCGEGSERLRPRRASVRVGGEGGAATPRRGATSQRRTLAVMTESRALAERRRAVNEAKVERTRRLVAEREKEKARLDKKHRDEVFEKIQRQKEEAKALERAKKKAMEERFRANQEARVASAASARRLSVARAEAAEKHQERLGEFKRRTDAIFAEQQRKIRAKERAMEEKESARRAAKEQEARELAAHAEERRRKAEERLRSARRNSEAFLEERRRHILDKAEHAEAAAREARGTERRGDAREAREDHRQGGAPSRAIPRGEGGRTRQVRGAVAQEGGGGSPVGARARAAKTRVGNDEPPASAGHRGAPGEGGVPATVRRVPEREADGKDRARHGARQGAQRREG